MLQASPPLLALLWLAGCAGPLPPTHAVAGIVATAAYEGQFPPADVADAARALGWPAENGTAPVGFPAVVVSTPDLTLHAFRAHHGSDVWPSTWWLQATFELPEPVRVEDVAEGERWAQARGAEHEEAFLRAVEPIEREGGFTRANLTYSCLCAITVYD
ncbi:MAG TPA: hypothetical protein VFH78_01390 [Candidatus Thermoplasmatota archaeon]|nr:hypothetical protein [Candidatus Thermoplasmatota archaeon]